MVDIHLGDAQSAPACPHEDLGRDQRTVGDDHGHDLVERTPIQKHARVGVVHVHSHKQPLDSVVRAAGEAAEQIVGTVQPPAGNDVRMFGRR